MIHFEVFFGQTTNEEITLTTLDPNEASKISCDFCIDMFCHIMCEATLYYNFSVHFRLPNDHLQIQY
jgi:hypothetical protein